MKMILAGAALVGVVLAIWAGASRDDGEGAAQATVTVGVDTDPTGNTPTSLGSIHSCRSVNTGDGFEVDLFVTDVHDLLAWEAVVVYDMSVLNIIGHDVLLFQTGNPGSRVFDASEGLPDKDGRYHLAAADLAEPPAPVSGSGVLASLSLKAVGPGLSPLNLNGDGTMPFGPVLRDAENALIDDADGDGLFDGPIANAQIAVDRPCPAGTTVAPATSASPSATAAALATVESIPPPTGTPPATASAASPTAVGPTGGQDTTSGDGSPWVIACASGGAVAAVLLGSAAFIVMRRRRYP